MGKQDFTRFEFQTDILYCAAPHYLNFMGKLSGIFCELFGEKNRHKISQVHCKQ